MSLLDARLQVHWAVQVLARFGDARIEAQPDASHSSLTWDPESRRFNTGADPDGRRLQFDPVELAYRLERTGADAHEFALRGRTLDEALGWLAGLPDGIGRLEVGEPDVPAHPVREGAPFDADPDDLAELAGWFHASHEALAALRTGWPSASAVRCWPHHFDIAVLIPLDAAEAEPDPEQARSVGAGMTPGDATYAEPYWYVTPWPYPEDPDLPPLPAGAVWHTENWIGAVLHGEATLRAGPEGVAAFLAAAVEACAAMAGAQSSPHNARVRQDIVPEPRNDTREE
ncbi:MAG: hypothetical protein OEM96_05295 [Gemmatimonadota bacterium]|nr:hypothetical protein [Gemmatimonadota bacterium]